jgi:hypothetical protein
MEFKQEDPELKPETDFVNEYTIIVKEIVFADGSKRMETLHRVKSPDLPQTLCRSMVELSHLRIMQDLRGLAECQRNEGNPN